MTARKCPAVWKLENRKRRKAKGGSQKSAIRGKIYELPATTGDVARMPRDVVRLCTPPKALRVLLPQP